MGYYRRYQTSSEEKAYDKGSVNGLLNGLIFGTITGVACTLGVYVTLQQIKRPRPQEQEQPLKITGIEKKLDDSKISNF